VWKGKKYCFIPPWCAGERVTATGEIGEPADLWFHHWIPQVTKSDNELSDERIPIQYDGWIPQVAK
jgi:hypothetical protein